jgi:hypothetical protein
LPKEVTTHCAAPAVNGIITNAKGWRHGAVYRAVRQPGQAHELNLD